jgi:hypothetical protein
VDNRLAGAQEGTPDFVPDLSTGAEAPKPTLTTALDPFQDQAEARAQAKTDVDHLDVADAALAGFAGGFLLLGPLGTLGVVAVMDKPKANQNDYKDRFDNFRTTYRDEFNRKGREKRKTAALIGGAVGTALLTVLVIVTMDELRNAVSGWSVNWNPRPIF